MPATPEQRKRRRRPTPRAIAPVWPIAPRRAGVSAPPRPLRRGHPPFPAPVSSHPRARSSRTPRPAGRVRAIARGEMGWRLRYRELARSGCRRGGAARCRIALKQCGAVAPPLLQGLGEWKSLTAAIRTH